MSDYSREPQRAVTASDGVYRRRRHTSLNTSKRPRDPVSHEQIPGAPPRTKSFLRKRTPRPTGQHTPPAAYPDFENPILCLPGMSPADSPPPYSSSPPTMPLSPARKSRSSPVLQAESAPHTYPFAARMSAFVTSESDADDRDDDEPIYTAGRGLKPVVNGLRNRVLSRFGPSSSSSSAARAQERPKMICTTPGAVCAGETETERDEPPTHLPTSRIVPSSGPLIPPNTLEQRLTPFLFEFSRLLSIVPALFGTLYNLYYVFHPPSQRSDGRLPPERVDFAVSAIWAILTGYQCLCLTTGLLTRWRLYYPPLSTLIRLLALQGICWPATQLTCTILEHAKRPVIVWAVIGTTTCVTRSLQIWVTSNLWWETHDGLGEGDDAGAGPGVGEEQNADGKKRRRKRGHWRRWGGKWSGRRWDWIEVTVKCMLPAGMVYFVMAWAEQLRRELAGR